MQMNDKNYHQWWFFYRDYINEKKRFDGSCNHAYLPSVAILVSFVQELIPSKNEAISLPKIKTGGQKIGWKEKEHPQSRLWCNTGQFKTLSSKGRDKECRESRSQEEETQTATDKLIEESIETWTLQGQMKRCLWTWGKLRGDREPGVTLLSIPLLWETADSTGDCGGPHYEKEPDGEKSKLITTLNQPGWRLFLGLYFWFSSPFAW